MKTSEELRQINKKRVLDQICYVTDDYKIDEMEDITFQKIIRGVSFFSQRPVV